MTKKQATKRIMSQFPLKEKVALADVVLDNSLTLNVLYQQVDFYLNLYFQ